MIILPISQKEPTYNGKFVVPKNISTKGKEFVNLVGEDFDKFLLNFDIDVCLKDEKGKLSLNFVSQKIDDYFLMELHSFLQRIHLKKLFAIMQEDLKKAKQLEKEFELKDKMVAIEIKNKQKLASKPFSPIKIVSDNFNSKPKQKIFLKNR